MILHVYVWFRAQSLTSHPEFDGLKRPSLPSRSLAGAMSAQTTPRSSVRWNRRLHVHRLRDTNQHGQRPERSKLHLGDISIWVFCSKSSEWASVAVLALTNCHQLSQTVTNCDQRACVLKVIFFWLSSLTWIWHMRSRAALHAEAPAAPNLGRRSFRHSRRISSKTPNQETCIIALSPDKGIFAQHHGSRRINTVCLCQ